MGLSRAKKLELERRRYQELELAIAGATTRQISQRLLSQGIEISHVQVANDIKRALSDMADANEDGARYLRKLFNVRYERMFLRLWPISLGRPGTENKPEELPDYNALGRVLEIMREVRRLNGLDMPIRQEVTGAGGGPLQVERREHEPDLSNLTDDQLARILAVYEAEQITSTAH